MSRIANLELVRPPRLVVGLDLSLRATGFAIYDRKDGDLSSRLIKVGGEGPGRLKELRSEIIAGHPLFTNDHPSLVMIEGYSYGPNHAAHYMGELGGVIRLALYEAHIPFLVVPPARLKKFVTGKGNADKNLVLKEVYKRFGLDVDDDNLADAVALCFLGRALIGEWEPTADFQRAVIEEIRSGKEKKAKKASKSNG